MLKFHSETSTTTTTQTAPLQIDVFPMMRSALGYWWAIHKVNGQIVALGRADSEVQAVVAAQLWVSEAQKAGEVQLVDSTSGVMCNGFTYLNNGVGHLLTPYDTMTDWDMWGLGAVALPAIEAAKLKMERLTMPEEEMPVIAIEGKAAA